MSFDFWWLTCPVDNALARSISGRAPDLRVSERCDWESFLAEPLVIGSDATRRVTFDLLFVSKERDNLGRELLGMSGGGALTLGKELHDKNSMLITGGFPANAYLFYVLGPAKARGLPGDLANFVLDSAEVKELSRHIRDMFASVSESVLRERTSDYGERLTETSEAWERLPGAFDRAVQANRGLLSLVMRQV